MNKPDTIEKNKDEASRMILFEGAKKVKLFVHMPMEFIEAFSF